MNEARPVVADGCRERGLPHGRTSGGIAKEPVHVSRVPGGAATTSQPDVRKVAWRNPTLGRFDGSAGL